jgi:hypothetical protein
MEKSNQPVVRPATVTFAQRKKSPAVDFARMNLAARFLAKEETKAATAD